ncbi:hypothetical protein WDU94_001798 [Cyamophila willieti]
MKTELRYCVACGESITDKYLLQVSDKAWHAQCLRCCICQLVLDRQPSCFIKDEAVYCKQDYAKNLKTRASESGSFLSISGPGTQQNIGWSKIVNYLLITYITYVATLFENFMINNIHLKNISETIIKHSIHILHHHIYT